MGVFMERLAWVWVIESACLVVWLIGQSGSTSTQRPLSSATHDPYHKDEPLGLGFGKASGNSVVAQWLFCEITD
jgi:hypothetical protein